MKRTITAAVTALVQLPHIYTTFLCLHQKTSLLLFKSIPFLLLPLVDKLQIKRELGEKVRDNSLGVLIPLVTGFTHRRRGSDDSLLAALWPFDLPPEPICMVKPWCGKEEWVPGWSWLLLTLHRILKKKTLREIKKSRCVWIEDWIFESKDIWFRTLTKCDTEKCRM